MTRPLLILLMVCSGCGISRQEYLRDRLQDSQDKQEQRKFNAEVLRRMEVPNSKKAYELSQMYWDTVSDQSRQIFELQKALVALEKKMDERKEPCDCGKATWDFEKALDEIDPDFIRVRVSTGSRLPRCDGSAPKP